MSWASRRQGQYLLGLFVFLGLIGLIIAWPTITRKPTCFDGKQNGAETGIDCGGACQRVCSAEASEPQILWYRAFPVSGNIYNLVAFVENQNTGAGVALINYEFRIYDSKNILIGRRQGSTFIPPSQQFAVFEPRFDAGATQVKSITFEFTSPFVWVKKAPTVGALPIHVENIVLGNDDNSPSLSARLVNDSIYNLPSFDVIAILYDENHNAINASKTYKQGLMSNDTTLLLFTWPQPFSVPPATKDILVQINPFTVSF